MSKILLVEDDIFISNVYEQIFSISGFDIKVAKDGVEALEKVKEFQPELIFLDMVMPRMDGLQTLAKLKEDESTKNIPVVMLSNLSDEAKQNESIKLGAQSFILKSEYEPNRLMTLARDIIAKNQ